MRCKECAKRRKQDRLKIARAKELRQLRNERRLALIKKSERLSRIARKREQERIRESSQQIEEMYQ